MSIHINESLKDQNVEIVYNLDKTYTIIVDGDRLDLDEHCSNMLATYLRTLDMGIQHVINEQFLIKQNGGEEGWLTL